MSMKIKSNKEWSIAVKMRDEYLCQHCGIHISLVGNQGLHAHHILPKTLQPDLALDVDNGITLCFRCHEYVHAKNRNPNYRPKKYPQFKYL